MLRTAIRTAARSPQIERLVQTAPITRDLVTRFVAGGTRDEAVRVTRNLVIGGLRVSIDYLGAETRDAEQAASTKDEYLRLIEQLVDARLAASAEVNLELTALGQFFDERLAYENTRAICAAAARAGTTVTLDMEDHTTTDATLDMLLRLRQDFPTTGAVLQAYLRRTEGDCRELATPGSRVRLCKGAYKEPESVAFQSRLDVDRSYVRCMNILMSGPGYPMLATHDPRLIAIGRDRAMWFDRSSSEFEFQMLYGARPREQRHLVGEGYQVRLYVPYGTQWYEYLTRRLAERPANLAFLIRAVASRH